MGYLLRNPVNVSVVRSSSIQDRAGGTTTANTTIGSYLADIVIPSERSSKREEDSKQPGISTITQRVFVFVTPYPSLALNDTLTVMSGAEAGSYTVTQIMQLRSTLQALAFRTGS